MLSVTARYSIVIGILLILLGVGTFVVITAVGDGSPSITALIPAFVGLPILLLGLMSSKDSFRVLGMQMVWALSVIGFALPTSRLAMQIATGAEFTLMATTSLVMMAALCALMMVRAKSYLRFNGSRPSRHAATRSYLDLNSRG